MKQKPQIPVFLVSSLLSFCTAVSAADIDLFTGVGASSELPITPNIVFLLDNSANWSSSIGSITQETMNRDAITATVNNPGFLNQLKMGVMAFGDSNSPRGSKVLAHTRVLDEAHRNKLLTIVGTTSEVDGTLNKTNNAPYAMGVHEALLYFRGAEPFSGLADGDHDPNALAAGRYISPAEENCGRNFLIVLGNGGPDSGEDGRAEEKLTALGGMRSSYPVDLSPDDSFESNWADEFSRFMRNTEVVPTATREGNQNVITYVIDVFNPDSNQRNTRSFKSARKWMQSIAEFDPNRYFAADSTDKIVAAIEKIVSEIEAVNSVFASSTLPVSVNVRGTNLNQVYMGVFRPDINNRTRWMGNLKLYQLAVGDGNEPFLADVSGSPAQNTTTGFINNNATSFWTTNSTFWAFAPRGFPESASDAPDGAEVEKGGAAQRQRLAGVSARTIYTSGGGTTPALSTFATSNADITQDKLGVATSEERTALINWVRGENNSTDSSDEDSLSSSTIRPSIHGDVLHSRPAVINMDGTDDGEIYVFYGSNDGHFRAVRGGRSINNDLGQGDEVWSFVPEEFLGDLKALQENTSDAKQYFVDGSIGVLNNQLDNRIWIYPSMRRGGRLLYALDVSSPTLPSLLWRRNHTDAGYAELGQTWSMPTPTRIKDTSSLGGERDVLIFGAGYDPAVEDHVAGDGDIPERSMGRGIFVVDAASGDVVWRFGPDAAANTTVTGMDYSIPSDLTVLDTNDDGLADRIYAGDTGGNLWRLNIGDSSPSEWDAIHLAAFGGGQKFLSRADVVYTQDGYDAVLIGSGDRERPFDTTVTNHFFMIKDTGAAPASPLNLSDLYNATDNLIQDGTDQLVVETAMAELKAAEGWYLTMENAGEKVVTNATTVNGTTFFNTSEPPPLYDSTCLNNLGTARNYMVSFADATAVVDVNEELLGEVAVKDKRFVEAVGGGFPPAPVAAIVEIDGRIYEAVISGTQVMLAPGDPLDARFRIWWNRDELDVIDG